VTAFTIAAEILAAKVNDAATEDGEPNRIRSSPAASAFTDAAGSARCSALMAPAESESVTMSPLKPSVVRRYCTTTGESPAGSDDSPGIRALDIITAVAPFAIA